MFGWIRGLFPTKIDEKAKLRLAFDQNQTQPYYEQSKSLASLAQGTIAACLRARAQERGVLRFIVKEYGSTSTRTAKRLTALFEHPNPVQSRVDFLELASQHSDQNGNAIIMLVNDESGLPVEQWIMPSYFVQAHFPDASTPIPDYYQWADTRISLSPEKLVFIRTNSFKTGPYKGRGITADDQTTAQIYDQINKAQANYFAKGGLFHAFVTSPQGVTWSAEQLKDFRDAWAAKFNPSTGTSDLPILQDGSELQTVGPTEMDFLKSKEESRDSIRESFQTPKVILGDTDNVNHNNGQTSLALFERVVVLRWGQKVAAAYEHRFRENIHPAITVEVDPEVLKSFTQLDPNNGVAKSQPENALQEA